MFSNIEAVRVQEINLTGSADLMGLIKYTQLGRKKPKNNLNLDKALPIFSNISYYPVVNEIVHIVSGPRNNSKNAWNSDDTTNHYYLPPINLRKWNINNNAQPNSLSEEELEANSTTGLDPYFTEIKNIKPLHPFGGDVIIEGRYGNSIRFGSTVTEESSNTPWSNEGSPGNPITIIRNGQSGSTEGYPDKHTSIVEDINEDNSSIYLCANQQLTNFKKAGVSPNEHPASYKHILYD